MQKSWRGSQEWRDLNMPLYTGSEQACKLYDASLSQMLGWYSDQSLGGILGTIKKIHEEDPNFVMGYVLSLIMGVNTHGTNAKEEMLTLAEQQDQYLSDREKHHVKAAHFSAQGEERKAALEWEAILNEHPTDFLALNAISQTYLMSGLKENLRNCVASVYPYYKPSTPYYEYIHGWYAFGMHETHFYKKAEEIAIKGLSINPNDVWATHALSHVYEMEGRATEGINFLSKTVKDWEPGDSIAGHSYWHWALFHIEKMEYDAALEILENELLKRAKEGGFLNLVDTASLLYRLTMEGVDVTKYWNEVHKIALPFKDSHASLFLDMHTIMPFLALGDEKATEEFMDTLTNYIKEGTGDNAKTSKLIALPIMQSLIAAKEKRYADVVDQLFPIRPDLHRVGGSDAQRDVLDILLITSALRSNKRNHNLLAKRLLLERQARKTNCSLEKRLTSQQLI